MDPLISFVLILTFAVIFASIFQRIKLSRIVGYVVGGMLIFGIVEKIGLSLDLQYSEPFKEIGLILFFFEVGTLLDISEMRMSFSRVISSELLALTIYWVSANFLSILFFSSELEKLILFLFLTNCSTASIVTLFSMKQEERRDIIKLATLQASIEDLVQFTIFSILITLEDSRLSLFGIMTSTLKIAGAAFLIYFVTSTILKKLRGGDFIKKPTNKFILALVFAMSVSLIAGSLGLPTFFGAFIAGISFKSSLGVSEISEMMSGLWELGVLFFFSSIGADVLHVLSNGGWVSILVKGALFGGISVMIRSIALSMGGILSGVPLETAVQLSFLISTLSENGMIFANMLSSKGILSSYITGIAVISVITSLLLQYPIAQKSHLLSLKTTQMIPVSIKDRLTYLSKYYYSSVDLAFKAFSISSYFFASLLIISYLIYGIKYILANMNLSLESLNIILSATNLFGVVTVTVLFIYTLRSIYRLELSEEKETSMMGEELKKYTRGFGVIISIITILIQLNMVKDFFTTIGSQIVQPEEFGIFTIALLVIMLTLIFSIRYKGKENSLGKA